MIGDIWEEGVYPEVKFGVSSGKIAVFLSELDMQIALLLVVRINISAYIVSATEQQERRWLRFIFEWQRATSSAVRVRFCVCEC